MSASVIAVKIADGRFAPVLDTETPHRHRRLVLTTVHDNQSQMQIDLYRSDRPDFADARYVGSLVLEDIEAEQRGEPEIALTLRYDSDGNLVATAKDMKRGSYQSLSVNVETLSEDDTYDVGEFKLDELDDFEAVSPSIEDEDDEFPDLSGVGGADASLDEMLHHSDDPKHDVSEATAEEREAELGFSPLLYLGFMVLALTLVGLLGFLVFRLFEGEPLPALEDERAALHPLFLLCSTTFRTTSLRMPGFRMFKGIGR